MQIAIPLKQERSRSTARRQDRSPQTSTEERSRLGLRRYKLPFVARTYASPPSAARQIRLIVNPLIVGTKDMMHPGSVDPSRGCPRPHGPSFTALIGP